MKRIVIVSLMVILATSLVFAQARPGGIARQLALGGSQAGLSSVLNPFLWDDPALVLFNPAYQCSYRDYMWSNIGGGQITGAAMTDGYGFQNAGVSFGLSNAFTLGLILSYDPSAANFVAGLPDAFPGMQRGSQSMPSIMNVWEAVATYRFTGMSLGLGLMYGWSNNDATMDMVSPTSASSETEASSSVLGLRLGALMELGNGVDLGITGVLRFDNATDRIENSPGLSGQGGIYEASGTEIQVTARAKIKMTSKFNFVPYAMLALLDAEPKEEEPPVGLSKTTASLKATSTNYAFGVGGEYRVDDFFFVGGVSWQHAEIEMEQKATVDTVTGIMGYTGIPVINIGGEWQITDWLTGRMGYFRSIGSYNTQSKYPNVSYEYNYSMPFSWVLIGPVTPSNYDGLVTLGVGLHFGNFAIDATVSEDALRRGIGLIGSGDAINTFGYMTASYNFGSK